MNLSCQKMRPLSISDKTKGIYIYIYAIIKKYKADSVAYYSKGKWCWSSSLSKQSRPMFLYRALGKGGVQELEIFKATSELTSSVRVVTQVRLLLLSWHSGMVIGVSLFLLDEEQLMIYWFAKKRSPRQVVFDQLNVLFWRLSSYHSDITMSFPRRVEILLFSFWYCLTCSFIAFSIKVFGKIIS